MPEAVSPEGANLFVSRLMAGAFALACIASSSFALAADSGTSAASPPDFYGTGAGWITSSNDFVSPASGAGPVTYDSSHPYVMDGTGAQPTFRVADLSNPILKPWVKDALRQLNEKVLAGHANYTVANTCRPAGVPNILLVRITPIYFLQTPNEVWIIWQNDHQVRRVYLNQPHSQNITPSWFGESVGHYEGDTLVVDTVGVSTKTNVDNYNTPHTGQLHTVERFHMVDGGKALQVDVTVDDPGAFNEPWSAVQKYRRADDPYLIEESCAETVNSPVDLGIPPIPRADVPDF